MTTATAEPAPAVIEAPEHTEIASVLLKAADILRSDGWIQGRGTGGLCAFDSIHAAAGCTPNLNVPSVVRDAYCVVMTVIGGGETSLVWWNDRWGRTEQEVLAALEKAAELADRP